MTNYKVQMSNEVPTLKPCHREPPPGGVAIPWINAGIASPPKADRNDNFVIWIFLLVLSVLLLYFNWIHWHQSIIGMVGLAVYFGVNAITWGAVVERAL